MGMNSNQFREELKKIMPGYKWTVHRPGFRWTCAEGGTKESYMTATGILSSGFNRISTIRVVRRRAGSDSKIVYEVKSAGFGKRSPWLSEFKDYTLARAFRGLQKHYEIRAAIYQSHAVDLQAGREVKKEE